MNQVSAPVVLPSQSTTSSWIVSWSTAFRSTASMYTTNHDRSWPPSASPNSLYHGIQVCMIMAFKWISQLAQSWLQSSQDYDLEVHLQTCTIMASKCISKLARLRPPSASLSSIDLQMHLQTPLITASMCVSKFTPSQFGEMAELMASEGNSWERAVLAREM
jgi:hypothetical protein